MTSVLVATLALFLFQNNIKSIFPNQGNASDAGNFTKLMVAQEELKTLPFGDIWDEYCRRCGKPADGEWFPEIEAYEANVLSLKE